MTHFMLLERSVSVTINLFEFTSINCDYRKMKGFVLQKLSNDRIKRILSFGTRKLLFL